MNEITQIRTISDEDAVGFVSTEALVDLAELITSMPLRDDLPHAGWGGRANARGARWHPTRPRWRAGLAFASMGAAIVVGAMTLGHAGSRVGPVDLGPGNAQALSFTKVGRYIVVIVRNPLADPARYRADFAAHHLDIKLQMIPASPSLVGQLVSVGGTDLNQLKPISSDAAKCQTPGGAGCQIGVKVSTGYHGTADLAFARAAEPGEQYESAGSVTAPGEAMHGLHYKDLTVNAVLSLLNARHIAVPQYRRMDNGHSRSLRPRRVPGDWLVQSAVPWAPHQVLLFVTPTRSSSSTPPPQTRTTSS